MKSLKEHGVAKPAIASDVEHVTADPLVDAAGDVAQFFAQVGKKRGLDPYEQVIWDRGDGAVRKIRFRESMTAAILSNRRRVAPFGLAGGESGAAGKNSILRADGGAALRETNTSKP